MSQEDNKITDCDIAEKEQAIINRENFEKNIANLWGHSSKGLEAKQAAMTMLSTKNGMYARIPLMCKGDCCPYASTCKLLQYDLAPAGEPCPVETAEIELRYVNYNDQFNLDNASFTDRSLISELINLDIMAERCKALISKEEVPVIDVVAGIAENGEAYTRPEVSKYWDAYERTLKRRQDIMQLMMATRKDNKDNNGKEKSIFEVIQEVAENGFVEETKPDNIVDAKVIKEEKE